MRISEFFRSVMSSCVETQPPFAIAWLMTAIVRPSASTSWAEKIFSLANRSARMAV